jgi:hypothetical protein
VRALQVAEQAAGLFVAAAAAALRRIIIIFYYLYDADKLPTFADFVIANFWQHLLEILYRCIRNRA